jgi:hypothetical protein
VRRALGGYKMLWIARPGVFGAFSVTYRRLDEPSSTIPSDHRPRVAQRLRWAVVGEPESVEPGCWDISARVDDVSLGFVADVVRGPG